MKISFLLFLFGAVASQTTNSSQSKQTLFEIIPDRVDVLFEDKEIVETNFRVKKVNKTRIITGSMSIKVPFGNDCIAECKILKKRGGEYRYQPYYLPPSPLCVFMSKDIYFYPDISKVSDFPEDIKNNCPLIAKNYSVYNYQVNTKNIVKIVTPTGEYSAEIIMHRNNQHIATYRFFAYINNV